MPWVKLQAPAKVNLILDVLGKREDGYHELRTVMQTVDLCNSVRLALTHSPETYLFCNNPDVPCDDHNLAWQAAQRLFEAMGIPPCGLDITLEKVVPMEAGLAGGSADAAAALVGLNELLGAGLTQDELCAVGARVGADVPFCIAGGLRLCEGIGERFTPLPPLPDCWIVVAKPMVGMKTARAFALLDAAPSLRHPDADGFMRALPSGDLPLIGERMGNVFEEALRLPEVDSIRQAMLGYGACGSCMTGSGTAVIGLFAEKRLARRCANRLKGNCRAVFVTHPTAEGAHVVARGE